MESYIIMEQFSREGVELWEDNGKLRYRARKGKITKEIRARISDNIPEILSALRAEKEREGTFLEMLVLDPENRHAPFPATGLQSAYLLGRQDFFELGNVSCQSYVEFEGQAISVQRLTTAWQELIRRHEMLRAVFNEDGSQRILEEVPDYVIPVLDLRDRPRDQLDKELAELRKTMSRQVLDPEKWPLFDLKAVLTDDETVRFLISIDMLIADFFSIRILFNELFKLHNYPEQSPVSLSASFRDYVMMSEQRLPESEQYQKSRAYWMDRLPLLPPAPALPLAQDPSKVQNPGFSRHSYTLGPKDWQGLKQLAQNYSVTPSAALLTVYADILGAWSNQAHFTLNLTILNRLPVHPEIMDVVGDFTSVNLLEVDLERRQPFLRRAKGIQNRLWDDLEHRYFDGVSVLREMSGNGASRVSMPVVFTSTIGMGSETAEVPQGFGVGDMIYSITQTPQVWLDFQLGEMDGTLMLAWDYVEDLFPEGMLAEMFNVFQARVHALAHNESAWEEVSFGLVPEAQARVREAANRTETPVEERLLHQLFEDRAVERPDHVAVKSGDITLRYKDLSRRSNILAHLLREKGMVPNRLVAVVMEKGWEQVVAVLGILKAGGAYLPIDPSIPELRLRHLLEHGETDLVLTQERMLDRIPDHLTRIPVDTMPHRTEWESPLDGLQKKEDLAYVIYTSGSTGQPKGVMINHAGAVNSVVDINRRFGVGAQDVVLGLSNLNFDLSVYDIFGTLAAGGTLVLPESDQEKEPGHWIDLMQREKITIWNSVPAFMEMLLQEMTVTDDPFLDKIDLRLVLLSGDYIPPRLAQNVHTLFNPVSCISLGGATEASIWSIFYPVGPEDFNDGDIPYGRPLANQRFHVLDSVMEPCPDWAAGDLYIAGMGLAKGYWRDEAKTTDVFIRHPISGERLYRTGDIGFYRPDGNIRFIGRKDAQVKIRGHRIELGEIQATIRQYPGVKDAVAAVFEDGNRSRQIAAHVVAEKETAGISPEETAAFDDLVREAKAAGEQLSASLDMGVLADFSQWVHRLTTMEIAGVVTDMGLFTRPGEIISLDALTDTYGIRPEYRDLAGQWLMLLAREGLLRTEGRDKFCRELPFPDSSPAIEGEKRSLWLDGIREIIQECGKHAKKIIRGEITPMEVFFHGPAPLSPESLVRSMPGTEENQAVLMKALKGYLDTREGEARILEIGAGTGTDTRTLLEGLDLEHIRYTMSATSPFFINMAKKHLDDFFGLEYRVYNPEQDPREQGLPHGGFDIILGFNSFHRSKNLPRLLGYLRFLLAPGGVVLFSEGTVNTSFQLITVGLIEEGFTRFEDERAGSNAPLLSVRAWQALLEQSGFQAAGFSPVHEPSEQGTGQAVIYARVPAQAASVDFEGLNEFVKQRLPGYMVPGIYTHIDRIPLSPNGKIDRKKLPIPDTIPLKKTRPQVPPSTETEHLLAEIWCRTLNTESIGTEDDFFGMGGDSLLAHQILTRFRKKARIRVPLRALFENTTIFKLGRYIDENRHSLKQEPIMEEGMI